MWRVHYYLAWFLYIDGQEAMCNAFKDLGRNQIVLMLWLQKKKKQKSTPRVIWNQHQAIEGKTPTINFIIEANCIYTIPNSKFFKLSSKLIILTRKGNNSNQ